MLCSCITTLFTWFLAPIYPQALSLLQAQFPIERARMRLRLAVPAEHMEALQRCLNAHDAFLEGNDSSNGTITMVVQVRA